MRVRWRGMELPSRVIPVSETLSDTYGMFFVEPFEPQQSVVVVFRKFGIERFLIQQFQ